MSFRPPIVFDMFTAQLVSLLVISIQGQLNKTCPFFRFNFSGAEIRCSIKRTTTKFIHTKRLAEATIFGSLASSHPHGG